MKSLLLAGLIAFVSAPAFAQLGFLRGDDETPHASGFQYKCSNLNSMGTLIIEPSGPVHFYFPDHDVAHAITDAKDAPKLRPSGAGGQVYAFDAWAAGTLVRVPDVALSGPQTFSMPWTNISFMGHGTFRGVGRCIRVQ